MFDLIDENTNIEVVTRKDIVLTENGQTAKTKGKIGKERTQKD